MIRTKTGSSGNLIYIKNGNDSLLIEAGIPPKKSGLSASEIRKADAMLISHEHKDHCRYVNVFLEVFALNVYLSQGTKEALGLLDHFRLKTIKPNQFFIKNSWRILPLPAFHDASEPLSFFFEHIPSGTRYVFITDTGKILFRLNGVIHYAIIEANYINHTINKNLDAGKINGFIYRRIRQNHLSLTQSLRFLERHRKGLIGVYFVHLSQNNADPLVVKMEAEKRLGVPCYVEGVDNG